MSFLRFIVLTLALTQASVPPMAQSLRMQGAARNVTVAKQDSVKLTVKNLGRGVYAASGSFNNVDLFGKFEATGRSILQCSQRHSCLQFMGLIDVGGLNGGWPVGTKTSFTLSIHIQPDGKSAHGVYQIGPLANFDFVQFGIMEMTVENAD